MYFRADNIMIDFSRVEVIWKEKNYIHIKFYESDCVIFRKDEISLSFDELVDAWQNRLQGEGHFVFTPRKKK